MSDRTNIRSIRLSDRQGAVLAVYQRYEDEGLDCPTQREVGAELRIRWSAVNRHLDVLEHKGRITRDRRIARSVKIIHPLALPALTLPEDVHRDLHVRARRTGAPVEQVAIEAMRDGLRAARSPMLPAEVSRETTEVRP